MRWLLVLAILTACTDEPLETDEVEASDDDKADAASELRVRVADTTVWVDKLLVRRGDLVVLSGRTSRTITDGRAFIFDDVYGDFAQKTARTFEVTWPVLTARGVVDGVNLFTGLTMGSRSVTARVVVRPRATVVSGATALTFTSEVMPVIVAGRTVYRVKGRSTQTLTSIAASAGTARLVDATHFEIDLDFDQVTSPSLDVTANGTLAKRVALGMYVRYFGATTGDVEEVFPVPTCTAERKACLAALPDGELDLASCGPALLVQACRGQLGVVVDQTVVSSTLADVDARLAGPFASDATALVGNARAMTLRTNLRAQIAAHVNAQIGLWLLSQTARQRVLGVERAFDAAYANPLALVPASPLAPGDVAKTRQVVADALLAYLQTTDYENSEFSRSYEELTRVFRAQHVSSLREFRENVQPEMFGATAYYIDRWLGTHTEIGVNPTTGAVTSVLVELD